MPVAGGPNTLGESNLVFAYDTGDMENSYKGAPTTNICTGADYSIYNDGASNVRNQTYPPPFKPGYEVVKVAANTPGTYGQSILWVANYSSSPATATNSVYAWLESGTFVQVGQHWFPWNYGSAKYIEKGKWVRISETYAINEGGSYSAAAMVYSTDGVAYFCMPQYELKPYMTPFVNFLSTRSATQGLLPVIGNSTIDLTNVSFNSNAQISLDGSNDYVKISQNNNYFTSQWAWELVVKFTGNTGTYQGLVWAEGDTGGGSGLQYLLTLYNHTYFHYRINNANTGWANTDTSTINFTPSNNNHIVWQFNNGVTSIYVNGALFHTDSGRGAYNGGTNSPVFIGARNDGAFSSAIQPSVIKQYNRILSAQEIKQNYQQYKTRFNLS